jgi:hypothetical protein
LQRIADSLISPSRCGDKTGFSPQSLRRLSLRTLLFSVALKPYATAVDFFACYPSPQRSAAREFWRIQFEARRSQQVRLDQRIALGSNSRAFQWAQKAIRQKTCRQKRSPTGVAYPFRRREGKVVESAESIQARLFNGSQVNPRRSTTSVMKRNSRRIGGLVLYLRRGMLAPHATRKDGL